MIEKPENLSTRAVSALKGFRKIVLRLAEMAGTEIVQGPMSNVQSQNAPERGSSPTVREDADSDSLVSDIVKAAMVDTGYEYALKGERTDEAEARLENLQELVNAAVDYDEKGVGGLREFIDHSALVSDADQYKREAPVTLLTAHSAKGLEFPLVFIVGLEDRTFPSLTCVENDGPERTRGGETSCLCCHDARPKVFVRHTRDETTCVRRGDSLGAITVLK